MHVILSTAIASLSQSLEARGFSPAYSRTAAGGARLRQGFRRRQGFPLRWSYGGRDGVWNGGQAGPSVVWPCRCNLRRWL